MKVFIGGLEKEKRSQERGNICREMNDFPDWYVFYEVGIEKLKAAECAQHNGSDLSAAESLFPFVNSLHCSRRDGHSCLDKWVSDPGCQHRHPRLSSSSSCLTGQIFSSVSHTHTRVRCLLALITPNFSISYYFDSPVSSSSSSPFLVLCHN